LVGIPNEIQSNCNASGYEEAENYEKFGSKAVNARWEDQTRRDAGQSDDDCVPVDAALNGSIAESILAFVMQNNGADLAHSGWFAVVSLLKLLEAVEPLKRGGKTRSDTAKKRTKKCFNNSQFGKPNHQSVIRGGETELDGAREKSVF
jgi:hypothetical protein